VILSRRRISGIRERLYSPAEGIHVLPTYAPIPGYGILPINAFVLKAKEPVLVDCTLTSEQDEFMTVLSSTIDPQELKWLWITHTDRDHVGNCHRLMEEVPHLRVITTYLGAGKMSLISPLPMDRVYFLNPGQSLHVGDRKLIAVQPPIFDAPKTTGFIDSNLERFSVLTVSGPSCLRRWRMRETFLRKS
jgi:hypothetical protein